MLFRHIESNDEPGHDIAIMCPVSETPQDNKPVISVRSIELPSSRLRLRFSRLRKCSESVFFWYTTNYR